VLIPPAYGLRGVPVATYTGDGSISYWNAYVAITQMGGQGVFKDERIDVEVERTPDVVHQHLSALLAYQLSLPTPAPEPGAFDPEAAARGKAIFRGKGKCDSCHEGETFTDAGETLHAAEETGMDPLYATRSATGLYRTTPLRGLLQHPPYFHDGAQATLADVVEHYDTVLDLDLSKKEKRELTEYLKCL
jgi:cytochrome c peroxidase